MRRSRRSRVTLRQRMLILCEGQTERRYFVQTTRIFVQPDELIKNLQQYHPNYQKARQNDFAHLKQQLDAALTNAMWLRAQVHDETTHCTDHLTWTNVDLLVKTLIQKND